MKRISAILLTLVLAMSPVVLSAADILADGNNAMAGEMVVAEREITVDVSGSNVRVVGAAKQTLTIYYLTGIKAASYLVETDDQTFATGLNKGVYLVKVGKYVSKKTFR